MASTPPATAATGISGGSKVVDVRSAPQHARDGLPGSLSLPLERIEAGEVLAGIERHETFYLVCEVGGFSETFRTAASACIIGDGALAARYRQVFAARNLLSHSLDGDECAITGLQYLRRHLSENR